MKRILITALLVTIAMSSSALAKDKLTAIAWNISVPMPDTRDFIDEVSFRGIGIDARQYLRGDSRAMVGFHFAWHVLDKRTSEVIALSDGAIKGQQGRYINSFPMMLTYHWYVGDLDRLRFFFGAGAGTYFIIQRFEIGVNVFEEKNWHLGLAPEFGVQFPVGDVDAFIQVKYNWAAASGESISGESVDYNYVGLNVGWAYARW